MNAEMISLGEMGGRGERRLGWRAHGDSHATRSRGSVIHWPKSKHFAEQPENLRVLLCFSLTVKIAQQ